MKKNNKKVTETNITTPVENNVEPKEIVETIPTVEVEEVISEKELTEEDKAKIAKASEKREKRLNRRLANETKRKENYKKTTLLTGSIPCKENRDKMEAKRLLREKQAERLQALQLSQALAERNHKTMVAEKMKANHRIQAKAKEEAIASKRELIKSLTPERLAELAKRRIDRKEKSDEQKVKTMALQKSIAEKFAESQKLRNEKKNVSTRKVTHTPEDIARIQAECAVRKEAKKQRNLAIAKIVNAEKLHSYTVVCSFVRANDTVYTTNKRIQCSNVNDARKIGQKLFERYTLASKKRSKCISKLAVYPDFGTNWGNDVFNALCSEKKVSEALNVKIEPTIVKEASKSHEKAIQQRNNTAKKVKMTKAERLMKTYVKEAA